jgi:hypothetical protein
VRFACDRFFQPTRLGIISRIGAAKFSVSLFVKFVVKLHQDYFEALVSWPQHSGRSGRVELSRPSTRVTRSGPAKRMGGGQGFAFHLYAGGARRKSEVQFVGFVSVWMVGAVGIELKAMLKARKLLIPLNAKNAKNTGFAQVRYTPGTREP